MAFTPALVMAKRRGRSLYESGPEMFSNLLKKLIYLQQRLLNLCFLTDHGVTVQPYNLKTLYQNEQIVPKTPTVCERFAVVLIRFNSLLTFSSAPSLIEHVIRTTTSA